MSRRRPRPRTRVKKGNLLFFILMALAIYIYFNRNSFNEKVEEITEVVAPNSNKETGGKAIDSKGTATVDDAKSNTPTKEEGTADKEAAAKLAAEKKAQADKEAAEKLAAEKVEAEKKAAAATNTKKPTVNIQSTHGTTVFVGVENKLQLKAEKGVDVGDLTIWPENASVEVKTIDKAKGLYSLTAKKMGKIKLDIMGKRADGKTDVFKSQVFEIRPLTAKKEVEKELAETAKTKKAEQASKKYMWEILSEKSGTLTMGKNNPIEVAIAEIDPKLIRAEISGNGNAIVPAKEAGKFDVKVGRPGKTKITVKLADGNDLLYVGEKDFIVEKGEEKTRPKPNVNNTTPPNPTKETAIAPKATDASTDNAIAAKKPSNNTAKTTGITSEQLPDPEITFSLAKEGVISVNNMKKGRKLTVAPYPAKLKTNLRFGIEGFTLKHYPSDGKPTTLKVKGAGMNPAAMKLIQNAQEGDLYLFKNIELKGTDGSKRVIKSLSYEIE